MAHTFAAVGDSVEVDAITVSVLNSIVEAAIEKRADDWVLRLHHEQIPLRA